MKSVASLRYGTIFKKAFSQKEIFTAFVRDTLGIEVEIEKVETEKSFEPTIGHVGVTFDLYAEDKKNRLIIDIQHKRTSDHYDRFLHYQCVALLEQVKKNYNYRPNLAVFSIVVLTSGDKHARDVSVINFDPHDLNGKPLGEIPHKIIYLCPKYVNANTPEPLQEWMRAIQDSLDEEVDESQYKKVEIQRVFDIIEKDLISPQERANMFEEYNQREAIRERPLQIARNLLAGGFSVEQVAQYTDFSVEEVVALGKS